LAADAEPPPPYVLEPLVVFGAAGLRASLAPAPPAERFVAESPSAAASRPDDEQADGGTRVRIAVPDPRLAVLERWIAGREGPSAFLVDDSVLLCASLAPTVARALPAGAARATGAAASPAQLSDRRLDTSGRRTHARR
jgi:hypothetical protein